MKYLLLTLLLIAATAGSSFSQDAPIPIQIFTTSDYMSFEMNINKKFQAGSRLGFFNVTTYRGYYDNDQSQNEYLTQSYLVYELTGGLSLSAGALMHFIYGFRPTAGLQYSYISPEFLMVLFPRFDLTEDHNFEIFGFLEYKPPLDADWALYSSLQGMYNHNVELNAHDRSYIFLRLGVTHTKYTIGMGGNIDFFGPDKANENRLGAFLRVEL